MKKLLSIVLAVILLVSAMPLGGVTVSAETATSGTTGDCTWSLDGTVLTISGIGQMADYDSYSNVAPWGTEITEVIIEKGVTSIGNYSFYNCLNIASITIPDSVTGIGSFACGNLLYSRIQNVYITDIAAWCNIDFVDQWSNPLYYSDNLYLNNQLVTDITIPQGVTEISDYLFSCNSLRSISISDSVISIATDAFYGCSSLESITVDENNQYYSSLDGVLFNKDKTELIKYPIGNKTEYTIPDSVTSIGDSAFSECNSLTTVTIGKGVTTIGTYAFNGCNSLKNLYITDIAAWCNIDFGADYSNPLYYADNLYLNNQLVTEVTIPQGVTKISKNAFSDFKSLTSITISNSVTFIGDRAFENCDSITSVIIPDSVTSIGDSAFSECNSLTTVTIGKGVTTIGTYAFYSCTSLISITIPDGVTSIGRSTFYNCSNLTNVTIGNGVTSIGGDAFNGCNNLWHVLQTGTDEQWQSIVIYGGNEELTSGIRHCNFDSSNITVTDKKEPTCTESGNITFNCAVCESSRTTYINSLGHDTENLKTIETCTLGEIEESFCTRCEEKFYTQIDNLVIGHNYENNICAKCGAQKGLSYRLIDNGIQITGCNESLTEVIIPDSISGISVTSIGNSAFYNCNRLTDVFYLGDAVNKEIITIGNYNTNLNDAIWHYNTCKFNKHSYNNLFDRSCNSCDWLREILEFTTEHLIQLKTILLNDYSNVENGTDINKDSVINICDLVALDEKIFY